MKTKLFSHTDAMHSPYRRNLRLYCLLLTACCLLLPGAGAFAQNINDAPITISSSGTYTITAHITLRDVNITAGIKEGSTPSDLVAFTIDPGATVYLTLEGNNTLSGGDGLAGLQVSENAKLEITAASSGSLTAIGDSDITGSKGGAGISGSYANHCGTITIAGGHVTAFSSNNGAGIGGGTHGSGGHIAISSGSVSATGSIYGAGIGDGDGKRDSGIVTVTVTGGSVKLNNHNGPQPTNGNGANVYLNTLIGGSRFPDSAPLRSE